VPYADNQGVRIHYEVEGDDSGPPLVLQHGLTYDLDGWRERGYVAALEDRFRLILIDARGHGRSDKPHDPQAYVSAAAASDVTAVLDDAGVDRAHYWGYSMGGWIGYSLDLHSPERVRALVIGGMHPYRMDVPPGGGLRAALAQGMAVHVASMEAQAGGLSPERKARLLANDVQALLARVDAPRPNDRWVEMLRRSTTPYLLYAGDADDLHDGVKRAAAEIPGCEFVSLPGLNHMGAAADVKTVVPRVLRFLERVDPLV